MADCRCSKPLALAHPSLPEVLLVAGPGSCPATLTTQHWGLAELPRLPGHVSLRWWAGHWLPHSLSGQACVSRLGCPWVLILGPDDGSTGALGLMSTHIPNAPQGSGRKNRH